MPTGSTAWRRPSSTIADLKTACHRIRPVLWPLWRALLALWLVMFLARCGLLLWQAERVGAQHAGWALWLEGLRFDGVLLGFIALVPAALLPWAATSRRMASRAQFLLRAYMTGWFAFVLLMEWSTPAFIAEYDARPNYLFVEYLGHLREVGGTLLAQRPMALLLSALLVPLASAAFWRWLRPQPARREAAALRMPEAAISSLLLVVACALLARGSLGHRPANPALAAITGDALVNQLPLSSAYTLFYALYQARKTEQGGVVYGTMPHEEMLRIVREQAGIDTHAPVDPSRPTWHAQAFAHARPTPRNLVIVLEESLGAEFVQRLGGLAVTPHLERLSRQGIWFEQLYATGTRSVRGIEAVVAGFPPTPAPSTVKLARSQRGFFTLASFLRERGYRSTFFYGGESHFDNMRSFFTGNGFDQVVDERDFAEGVFKGTWGVADGAVFDAAHASFLRQTQPFFGLVFTSSNHAPFEFPDAEIDLYESPRATVNNAVKYADHALGAFFDKARQAPYWQNTVFLVVADHNSRVYGDSLIPIKRFHIPGLILGGGIGPGTVPEVASQIDLAPTLLSLMGVQGSHPLIGRDLSNPAQAARPGRAILQFDKTQAYMEGPDVVVLRPQLPPAAMRYDPASGSLTPSQQTPAGLVQRALAHALYAQAAYREGWHR